MIILVYDLLMYHLTNFFDVWFDYICFFPSFSILDCFKGDKIYEQLDGYGFNHTIHSSNLTTGNHRSIRATRRSNRTPKSRNKFFLPIFHLDFASRTLPLVWGNAGLNLLQFRHQLIPYLLLQLHTFRSSHKWAGPITSISNVYFQNNPPSIFTLFHSDEKGKNSKESYILSHQTIRHIFPMTFLPRCNSRHQSATPGFRAARKQSTQKPFLELIKPLIFAMEIGFASSGRHAIGNDWWRYRIGIPCKFLGELADSEYLKKLRGGVSEKC